MKKIILPVLLLVGAMSSCSKNDVTEVLHSSDNMNAVGLNVASGVTRGADVTTASIQNTSNIDLYYASTAKTGKATFTCSAGDWISTDAPKWSELGIPGSTTAFYSMNDGSNAYGLVDATSGMTADAAFTTGEESANHKDLVYYAGELAAIPAGGQINAFHKHALSKVNFFATTGSLNVHIARVRLVNVGAESTPTITAPTTVTWTKVASQDAFFKYYADADASSDKVAVSFGDPVTAGADNSKVAIMAASTTPSVMMIPQALVNSFDTATQQGDNVADVIKGAYIEVIYCATDKNGEAIVGYTEAQKHPQYSKMTTGTTDTDITSATTPLYVKAAFPIASLSLGDNKAYDVILGLGGTGSTGGYVVSDEFVNKDGDKINLGIEETEIPDIDDPVFPDADAQIDIIVTVGDWEQQPDNTIL